MSTKRNRRRLHRSATIHVWLRGIPPILAVLGLLLGAGYIASRWDSDLVRCRREYDRAHTAADTASVDRIWLGGKDQLDGNTCGRMRRGGTLDRHRTGTERRRAAGRGDGHAVIEK
ncbi:MAG TPA: hypothetical protein VFR37_11615 [Longimicrobium sp.]|nr:hypothetical protein [Longimicrobium sp.]